MTNNDKICEKCGTTKNVNSYQFYPNDVRDLCGFCIFGILAKKEES